MNRFAIGATLATAAFAATTNAAVAARSVVPLSQAAAELGYTYSYLGPEDAVSLGRPGVTILIRPGERLFDVNDRTEAMEGPVPRFLHNDLLVSDQFVARLRVLAARAPGEVPVTAPVAIQRAVMPDTSNVTGSIVSFDVRQIPGAQKVDVSGKAPAPNLPITLTLVGTFASEIPDTVLTRRQVYSDSDGRFHTDVSIAPGYFRGAYLTLVASSVPGVASASIRFEMKPPNGAISVPAEQPQRSIR